MNPVTLWREIRFGNTRIPYRLKPTGRRKTVNIAVDPRSGVLVKAPVSLPGDRLAALIRRKAPWILERRRRLREISRPWQREFVSGESFTYLGRNYRLKVALDGSSPAHAALVGKRLRVVVGRHGGRARAVREALREWCRRRAAARLPERAAFWAKKLGVNPPLVIIREQAKRWGSCDRRGRLLLNWRIVLAPLSLVDYVIAHEACHLVPLIMDLRSGNCWGVCCLTGKRVGHASAERDLVIISDAPRIRRANVDGGRSRVAPERRGRDGDIWVLWDSRTRVRLA